jgi:hypothetical protein
MRLQRAAKPILVVCAVAVIAYLLLSNRKQVTKMLAPPHQDTQQVPEQPVASTRQPSSAMTIFPLEQRATFFQANSPRGRLERVHSWRHTPWKYGYHALKKRLDQPRMSRSIY